MDGLETYGRSWCYGPDKRQLSRAAFRRRSASGRPWIWVPGLFFKKPYVLEEIGVPVRQKLDELP